MRGKAEEIKGRVKEAAGVLTENKKLQRSGKETKPRGRSNKKSLA